MKAPYRLGLDIGTNSIGWAVLDLSGGPHKDANGSREIIGTRALGVRLFTDGRDPHSQATLATDRRLARSMRRRRDRALRRKQVLLEALTDLGLMPGDEAARLAVERLDPYALRAEALDQPLRPEGIGRALFHLNQRRGFKSNRKTDGAEDGLIYNGIAALKQAMHESAARTVGEYLHQRRQNGAMVRARPVGDGANKNYPFYLARALVEEEFAAIWDAQAHHHPDIMTEAARDRLHRIIFYQRPLKPVDPGKCSFIDGEKRAPQALPIFQEFRLLQELANLRIIDDALNQRPLTVDERDKLLAFALGRGKDKKPKKTITFKKIRSLLNLDPNTRFSLEDERRKDLAGDVTGAALIAVQKDKQERLTLLTWYQMDTDARTALIKQLLHVEEEDQLIEWLQATHGLEEAAATLLARKTALPPGYGRLSEKALQQLVPVMRQKTVKDESTNTPRPIRFDEACTHLGWHHSDKRTGEIHDTLPYYGAVLPLAVVDGPRTAEVAVRDHGWIANPTVHIGLNQLRQLINALIDRYGHPHEVVVELSRDLKLNKEQKDRRSRENTRNKKQRDEWRTKMREELGIDNPSHRDFMKLRLWQEMPAQRRVCIFSGQPISFNNLFSAEVEIEHIIPFSRSLDDGFMNKVLATRTMNRLKGNKTPFEAFGETDHWDGILSRITDLHPAKQKRFAADFVQETDFLARHLNDGRYLSRIARQYLISICHPDRVWVIPGQLTAMLRGKWGLNDPLGTGNQKNRADHRHHAVDAFVVACTSRAMLQRLSRASGHAEDTALNQLVDQMPPPYERFDYTAFQQRLRKLVTSHRPNRAYQGRMHNETAYYPTGETRKGIPLVRYREAITSFNKASDAQDIIDADIRAQVLALIERHNGKALEQALGKLRDAAGNPIRRVRVERALKVIPMTDKTGKAYKAYKGDSNWCFEIRADAKGKWKGAPVSTFEAYQRALEDSPPPDDLVMQLFKDDLIDIRDPDEPDSKADSKSRKVMRVIKFSGNSLVTAEHHEAGNLKARDADPDDPFKYTSRAADWYRQHDIRPAGISVLGRR